MNHTGRVCDKLEPRIQLNTFIGWLAKLRKSTTCWKTLGWTTKLCRCSTQNLKFLRLVLFVSWMAGVYGDACSADRQALVGSGRQSAGSCYLSELSRLHLEVGTSWKQTRDPPRGCKQPGETFTADPVQGRVTPSPLWWLLYIVFYEAFGRRADSQSSLMNKEKKR